MRWSMLLLAVCVVVSCGPSFTWKEAFTLAPSLCARDAGPGMPACGSDQVAGSSCAEGAGRCYSGERCENAAVLQCVCTSGCPEPETCTGCARSRAVFKQDVAPVDGSELRRYHDEVLALPLVTYRYRDEGPAGKLRLGYMLDEAEGLIASDPARDRVDLYSYATMTVAAVQVQQQELIALRQELEALRRELKACTSHGR